MILEDLSYLFPPPSSTPNFPSKQVYSFASRKMRDVKRGVALCQIRGSCPDYRDISQIRNALMYQLYRSVALFMICGSVHTVRRTEIRLVFPIEMSLDFDSSNTPSSPTRPHRIVSSKHTISRERHSLLFARGLAHILKDYPASALMTVSL